MKPHMPMIKTTTQLDVLKCLYNEASAEENKRIENELLCKNDLAEFYVDVVLVKETLDKVQYEPSQNSIDNILAFSKSYVKA